MSEEMKISNVHFFFKIFFTILFTSHGSQIDDVPSSNNGVAFFVFGDSFLDPGNNNFINTTEDFRANFTPYGETFFNSPTGRFSDGRLIPDFIAEYANLPLIPAYLDPHNNLYIHGVNFASGGGGALVETHQGFAINIETQLRYFKKVERSLRKKLGDARASSLLSDSVYMFSIGGNDYIVAFEGSPVLEKYTEIEYVNMVIGNVTSVLQEIYKKGGRKFAFLAVPPLGCMPHTRLMKVGGHGSCWDEASALARLHNKLLPAALQKLAHDLQGFKYTLADTYNMLQNRIDNPSKYGLKDGRTACCGSGELRGIYSCGGMRGQTEFELCENPNEYLFFDSYHPNERAYEQFAKLIWYGDAQFINPSNLKQFFQCGSSQA
ncbi:GDSL esterase/lipase 5-like [Cucurbita moschata]|uniref:GDSL esterase/lipase 5-like n=1 Tax=Cucurbita moschata TaxID=3662 RepID=A0A6J1HHR5_CUCMO|nr:GDSL esterase/lipase 5-like [Cucurbita moschata]